MNNLQIHNQDKTIITVRKDIEIHNAILDKTKELFEEVNDLPLRIQI